MEENINTICRKAIESKFNKGKYTFWTDSHYAELREEIHNETKLLISKNTLKRYFGKLEVPDDYEPQRETKNAFARYLRFEDWNAFEMDTFPNRYSDEMAETNLLPENKQKNGWDIRLIAGILAAFGFVSFLFVYMQQDSKTVPDWKFTIDNPKDTAPFTLFSRFRLDGSSIDTFSIRGIQKVNLNISDSIHSTFIAEPCYLFAEFLHNGKLLTMVPVHGLSKGWEVFYSSRLEKVKKKVLKPFTISEKGVGVQPDWFVGKMLDSMDFVQEISNFKDFPVEGDYFVSEIESTIPGESDACHSMCVRFFGSERHLEYQISSPVCPVHNFINLSEAFYSGNNSNFSKLTHPVNKKTTTRLEVANKKCRLLVDGRLVYSGKYKLPVGQLKGIKIQFNGYGFMNSVRLWDKTGTLFEQTGNSF